ncbi:hypothetical protein HN51_016973 [Arachis hypogaea]|nr:uncharacterized protein DS421_6g197730 [Arachis hypogaea]QHO47611.1 uncharacterized protein DS421_6g197730 [Arachis hypogaea]
MVQYKLIIITFIVILLLSAPSYLAAAAASSSGNEFNNGLITSLGRKLLQDYCIDFCVLDWNCEQSPCGRVCDYSHGFGPNYGICVQ